MATLIVPRCFSLPMLLSFFCLATGAAAAPNANDIMRQVSERDDQRSSSAEVEMVLIDNNGGERSRQMKIFSSREGVETSRVIFFLEPADIAGTAYLGIDHGSGDNDREQWLYLPALGKTKRIASGESSQSFMGSDLSYSDLMRLAPEDFVYSLLREDTIDSVPVWLIEAVPRSETLMHRLGYRKSLLVIRQDNYVLIRAVNWLLDENRLRFLEVRKLEKVDGIWAPVEAHAWTMAGKETIHRTIFYNRNLRFNVDLPPDLFTVHRLEQGP